MIKAVYVHIPFCEHICNYCDFCKIYYNHHLVDQYLDMLDKEISTKYKGEIINSIYIGGGTPTSLTCHQLLKLFQILSKIRTDKLEFTIESNIESLTEEKLKILRQYGINRISVGIQTVNDKYIKLLNRHHNKDAVLKTIKMVKKYINNINVDLIYAIPGQTLDEMSKDLDVILELDVNHISTYSLIVEEHTKLYINKVKTVDEDLDYTMYNMICDRLKQCGYYHYEISNFSKRGYESRHNLVYWNNQNYYGFGLGASGYIGNIRYDNTKSINRYLNGEFVYVNHILDMKETIENEFILGLRKIEGIDKLAFSKRYDIDVTSINSVKQMLKLGKLIDDGKHLYINKKYLYVSNDILIEFIN